MVVVVQPLASVTCTVYAPAGRLLKVAVVAPEIEDDVLEPVYH